MKERFRATGNNHGGNPEFLDAETGERGIFKIVNSDVIVGDSNDPVQLAHVWVRVDDGSKYRDRLKVLDHAKRFMTSLVKLHGRNFLNARPILAQLIDGQNPVDLFDFFEQYGRLKQRAGGTDRKMNDYLLTRGAQSVRGRLGKDDESDQKVALPVWARNSLAHQEDREGDIPTDPKLRNHLFQVALDDLRRIDGASSDQDHR